MSDPVSGEGSAALILLADDDRDSLEAYDVLLRSRGYRTALSRDGQETLEAAARLRPDLIMLDLGLPVVNGWQVLERLRADPATAALPVVVVTGHLRSEDLARARDAGCNAILRKPCDAQQLLEAARLWTDGARAGAPPDRKPDGRVTWRAPKPPGYRRAGPRDVAEAAGTAPARPTADLAVLIEAVRGEILRAVQVRAAASATFTQAAQLRAVLGVQRSAWAAGRRTGWIRTPSPDAERARRSLLAGGG
jgi:CheY-like chemotaxis protein